MARAASLLASTLLTNGKMAEAVHYAEMGVALARKSNCPDALLLRMASLGEVLHWVGEVSKAEEVLQISERMRREHRTAYNRNSLGRHNLCELLLDHRRTTEIDSVLSDPENDTLDIRTQTAALNQVVAARGHLVQLLENGRSLRNGIPQMDDAIAALRELFALDYLCRHLINRADYKMEDFQFRRSSRRRFDAEGVERDLSEAEEFISMGGFNTLRVDLCLVRARHALLLRNLPAASDFLAQAEQHKQDTKGEYKEFAAGGWHPPDFVSAFAPGTTVMYRRRDRSFEATREWLGQ